MLQLSKMNNKIIVYLLLMILVVGIVNAEKYFVLDVNYIIGYVTFNKISLKEIDRAIKYSYDSGFLIKTVSFENADLKTLYYDMSANKNYIIYIPYDKNAARIEVYNNNSKVMDIDVSSFLDTCGNNICDGHESYESCVTDCASGSKDDFCDSVSDGICDPDCSPKTDADCEGKEIEQSTPTQITQNQEQEKEQTGYQEEQVSDENLQPLETKNDNIPKSNYLFWFILIFVIAVLIGAYLFIKKRKESQITGSLKQYISENIKKGFTLQQIKTMLFKEGYREKEVEKAIKSI